MDSGCTIELAALGRPFTLGMLYDMRHDSLVTGMTLWDEETLTQHIPETQQNFNTFEIITSDSLQSKSSTLGVNGSLSLSILSGKVNVEGSGNYLKENKTSTKQERVTLMYKETKLFKQLSMHQLKKVTYPQVINKGLATHVVTGILYGAQAFFMFDREVSEDENQQDIHADLVIMAKKIPKFAGQARGDFKMNNEDQKKVDKFSCRFFGDVFLDKNPTTFQEAIETYRSLPELLKDGEKAVPMTVYMLPLSCLSSSASRLVHQINDGLVHNVQAIMEDFIELEMRCNDVLKKTTLQPFSQLGEQIKCFKDLCAELKLEFQETLAEKLPLIRGGEGQEAELKEILKERHSSDFNSKKLKQWIDHKENEIYTLMLLKEEMKNTTFIQSETQLYKESLNAEQVVCFVYTSLKSDETFLSNLSAHLKKTRLDDYNQSIFSIFLALLAFIRGTGSDDQDGDHHDVENEERNSSIRKKAVQFSDFAEANKDNSKIKFLAIRLTDEKNEGPNICLYEDGIFKNFEPPSKPEAVTVSDTDSNYATLKVSSPKYGAENIKSYFEEGVTSKGVGAACDSYPNKTKNGENIINASSYN